MIIKIIGCSVIVLCSLLMGTIYTGNLKLRIKELEGIMYMSEYMSTHIKYDTLTLRELFDEMSAMKKLEHVRFIFRCSEYMRQGENFPSAFEKAVLYSKKDMHLHIDDINIIMGLKNDLGATYIDGQIKTLSLFVIQIEEALAEAKDEYKKNGPMYQKLSALIGLGISILLF